MSFEIVGKLHKKFDTENKTASFQAREFVIEADDGRYPQMVKFQLVQDKCDEIDKFNEGDNIRVHFNLRGREWQGKYFTNLNAWRIELGTAAAPAAAPAAAAPAGDFPTLDDAPATTGGSSVEDDLPF